MILDENWAVAPDRVRAFFAALPGAEATENGFLVEGCQVRLTAIDGQLLGKWAMQRTRICIEGPDDAAKSLYRKFFLRFLSAGG